MKLAELYAQTPASQHQAIVVAERRVFVRSDSGVDEYYLLDDGELLLLRSDSQNPVAGIRQDLAQIKAALGI